MIITRRAWWRCAFSLSFRPFFFLFALWTPLRPLCSFAHILLSGTPIDVPLSSTRSTSKHLPIPTIYFSFKRSKCADMVALFFCVFWSFSHDPGLWLTISFRLRILQVSTFPSPPFFSVLNGRIICCLFYVLCFFLVHFCFYFRALLYVLWCITHLTSMLVRKNAFTPRNMFMHKWALVGTHEHMYVLRSTRDERCEFFWTQHLLKCCVCIYIFLLLFFYFFIYIFFYCFFFIFFFIFFILDTMSCIYYLLLFFVWVSYHVRIFLWGICFENHE